jgi:WD40 repeat protein
MVCQHCGNAVTDQAPAGLCPGCLLRTAAASGARDQLPELPRLRYFGDYELLEEISRGGMGVVYKARQMSLDRTVALKMMRPGLLATPAEVARFRSEAAAAARLRHPNIVTIFEVGEHDGLHYFSMDYVEGANLAQLAGGKPLPEAQAAKYVQTVAEAVEFAHRRGTVHRDLKPSNILIDEADRPRITDFGLAVQVGSEPQADVAGTPGYMAPEQRAGGAATPVGDVYALGAVLHELLGGARVSRDLETICTKAMAAAPAQRYNSAGALADDLGRYLKREPIRARRIGLAARTRRWIRRNPWQTTAAAALAIAAGQAYRSSVTFRERYFTGLLEQARLERATGNLAEARRTVRMAAAIHDSWDTRLEAVELAVTPGVELLLDIPFGWVERARFTEDSSRLAVQGPGYVGDPRSADRTNVVKVWDLATGKLLPGNLEWPAGNTPVETEADVELEPGMRLATRLTVAPGGRLAAGLVARGSQGELAIWDLTSGHRVAQLADNHSPVWSGSGLLATIGGTRVATRGGSMSRDGSVAPGLTMGFSRVRVWRVADLAPGYPSGEAVRDIAVSGDGRRLAVNDTAWQVESGRLRRVGAIGRGAGVLAASADGRRKVIGVRPHGSSQRQLQLWDTTHAAQIAVLNAGDLDWPDGQVSFSPDCSLVVAAGPHWRPALKVWRAETGQFLRMIHLPFQVRAFAFGENGLLVTIGPGAAIVDLTAGSVVRKWAAATMETQGRAVAVSSRTIATAGEDRMIHLWTLEGREVARWTAHAAQVTALAFAPGGTVLYSGAEDGTVRVWDLPRIRTEVQKLGVSW